MAKTLSAFLAQNVKKIETVKYAASRRIAQDGKPVEWEIGCITAAENNRLRQSCMRMAAVPGGKKGQTAQSFDAYAYQAKVAARCTLYPDLNDVELQNSYGVRGAEELLATMLTPGEFEDYSAKVLEVNGFEDLGEQVDEAKN